MDIADFECEHPRIKSFLRPEASWRKMLVSSHDPLRSIDIIYVSDTKELDEDGDGIWADCDLPGWLLPSLGESENRTAKDFIEAIVRNSALIMDNCRFFGKLLYLDCLKRFTQKPGYECHVQLQITSQEFLV